MMDKIKAWWALDEAEEMASADNPFAPLKKEQKQDTFPMLTLAFGWGFLITGLMTGGALGAGLPFWPDLVAASFLGNFVNFVVGALVGYMGFKTACNSGLLYRFVYGRVGVYLPVLFLSLLIIGWHAVLVGAFGFAWAQSFDSVMFYVVAILGGILFTITTYFGVKGIEKVSVPSVAVLVLVGLYAAYTNIAQAGGMDGFLRMSEEIAAKTPITFVKAINLVIGSWIVGAIVMAEYTRFAKKAWVALAIPFIVLIISQWFLQIVGSMGGIVSGTADFTTYMLQQGFVIGGIGLIGMSLALWTSGDANLYLPVIQTSSVLRRPKRVMVVICGAIGTVLGLGLYQHFIAWIDTLASIVPPLIGPVIVDYYLCHRTEYDFAHSNQLHSWNVTAVVAYFVGVISTFYAPDWIVASLLGLVVSMVVYAVAYYGAAVFNYRLGYAKINNKERGPAE
ncbi:MAG: cytosine permease [Deltaproteobacteria bacterium]|nr:cytosine permease [Deltaproteobacteria bacterium]